MFEYVGMGSISQTLTRIIEMMVLRVALVDLVALVEPAASFSIVAALSRLVVRASLSHSTQLVHNQPDPPIPIRTYRRASI